MYFRTQYDEPIKVQKFFEEPSLTDPSFKDECDLTLMIENYKVNRIPLPSVPVQYGFSPTADEYLEAQSMVSELKTAFESLPAEERDNFGNIQNYLKFIGNPDNLKESYERGLIDKSSVDLADVYPDRYVKVNKPSVEPEKPLETTSADVSANTQEG